MLGGKHMKCKMASFLQKTGMIEQRQLITADLELAKDLLAVLGLSDHQALHPRFQVLGLQGLCCFVTDYCCCCCCCCDSGLCYSDYDSCHSGYCHDQIGNCPSDLMDT